MAIEQPGQISFVEAMMPSGLGRNARLERLSGLVRWYRFEKALARLRPDGAMGRPAYPPLVMLKALLLQSFYGLSDADLEAALLDRLSFRRFAGLSFEGGTPDHTTLCRFRNRLVEAGLLDRLFGELDRQLDGAGLILRRGTMLDATVIETTAARPRDGGRFGAQDVGAQDVGAQDVGGKAAGGKAAGKARPASDPDARFTRRAGKAGSSFGYKAHVGVDAGSGLVRRVLTTPANVNDTVPADALICGDERSVLADAAYHTHARERRLKEGGVKARLMRRPNKHHPELSARLKLYNRLLARRRAAVETTFATWKRRMGLGVIRYRGLAKAAGQVMMTAIAFNMRRWAALSP